MASGLDIPSPKCFNVHGDPSKLPELWKKWKSGFDLYLTAANVVDAGRKKAFLLHCGGMDLQELFNTLPGSEEAGTYDETTTVLQTYFEPKRNKRYERHVFLTCIQSSGETISQYVTRLRGFAKTCEFVDSSDTIVDQVIEKCRSKKLRKRLLKERDLKLEKVMEIAQVMESADRQIEKYENNSKASNALYNGDSNSEDEAVNKIHQRHSQKHSKRQSSKSDNTSSTYRNKHTTHHSADSEEDEVTVNKINYNNNARQNRGSAFKKSPFVATKPKGTSQSSVYCFRCGDPSHLANTCKIAAGKKCNKCGKMGHFGNVCGTMYNNGFKGNNQQVTYIQGLCSSSDDDDFTFAIGSPKSPKRGTHDILINNCKTNVLIDSGSSVNVISTSLLKQISPNAVISPYKKKVFGFHSDESIPVEGTVCLSIQSHCRSLHDAHFIIVPNDCITILGCRDATNLDLLRIGPSIEKINSISLGNEDKNELDRILKKYDSLFSGLGKLKDVEVKVHVDESVQPVAQKARRLPILMQKQVDDEIEHLLQEGIIEPVTQPPTWVNPLVIVPKKDNGVRICVDMRAANSAVIREPYQIPTLDEITHEFNGCTVFCKLDLNKGYHQISLAPESRDLTTFATNKGLFRYLRLLFGLSAASEVYQRVIEQALSGISRVRNISDDILIGATNIQQLLQKLEEVLDRLKQKNLTLNKAKCDFIKSEITYMGHTLSANGVAPDHNRIESICSLKPPTNLKELRSFLGMITYCSKFIPMFATITQPLRYLLKKNSKWEWTLECEHAFNVLKETLLSAQILAYFNPEAPTEVTVDASPVGLGALISQVQPDGSIRPISYASRALSPTEQRYSQIERECLAIVFAIQRFKIYLYGIQFNVKTDHKPLLSMFSTRSTPPPRIERWVARLMPYNFNLIYQPGHLNSADYLSRSNPVKLEVSKRSRLAKMAEEYVCMISTNSLPNAVSLKSLQKATLQDKELQDVIICIRNGQFNKSVMSSPFFSIRHSLSENNGLLLYKKKIVIPSKLRFQIYKLAHEGHQGVVRTKQRLRSKVYWPGMNTFVNNEIAACHPCQVVAKAQPITPIKVTPIPDHSWLLVGCDLCGPFPSGEHLLVCIDYYSRYPEVEILHNISSESITSKLRKMFCRYGPPETIVTDNGPQFRKHTHFSSLLHEFGVQHRKVTPYHPSANGEVERFNRNLKKCIQTAIADGENWRKSLQNFLLSYRTTPHAATGVAPAELLFGQQVRDKLPTATSQITKVKTKVKEAKLRDAQQKIKAKKYADTRRHAKDHNIKVGDNVLVQNAKSKRDKFTPRWLSKPYMVTKIKGNAIFMRQGSKDILRTSSHVKPYQRSHYNSPFNNISLSASSCSSSEEYDSDETIPFAEEDAEIHVNDNILVENDDSDNVNVHPHRQEVGVESDDDDASRSSNRDSDSADEGDHEDDHEEEGVDAALETERYNRNKRKRIRPKKLNDYVVR